MAPPAGRRSGAARRTTACRRRHGFGSDGSGGTYEDFGPTLAAEKLLELDGIMVSRETVRQLQTRLRLRAEAAGRDRVFQTRERRPRFGELVQIDGSPHDWFEAAGRDAR